MKLTRIAAVSLLCLAATAASAQDMVVYHIDDMSQQALKGLRNIRNHLDVDPAAKITVVTHALGVDFLFEGAKDANGGAFAGPVSRARPTSSLDETIEAAYRYIGICG